MKLGHLVCQTPAKPCRGIAALLLWLARWREMGAFRPSARIPTYFHTGWEKGECVEA